MPASIRFHQDRLPALDGVRGIAILLVFGTHISLLPGGRIGVDLFFVLSGFLISSILLGEYRRQGTIHLGHFYLRRALRLLPALVLVVLGVIIYVAIFDPNKLAMTMKDAQAVILYYYNWKLVPIWRDLTSFQWMYTHLWSLSVEEQFYIVWPIFILIVLSMRIAVRTMFAVLAAGIILPAIGRALLWDPSQGQAIDLYFRTDLRFDALMWGALVAWMVHVGYRPQSPSLWRWVATAGAFVLLGLAFFDMMNDGYAYRGGFSLVGVLSALFIAGAIWCPPQAMIIRTLSLAPLRWTGKISYGLYLWHWPVALVVASYFVNPVLKGLLILMATFAIATASFYLVERRFLLLKDRIGQPSVAGPGATTAVQMDRI